MPYAPPGRPIISAIGGLFENTSRFIDFFLQPYVQELPPYIRDTGDFLTKIFDLTWSDNTVFITLDVQTLYTSIRHSDGLNAMHYYLGKRPIGLHQHTMMLLQLAEWCLENNVFVFDRLFYRQTQGTPMGTCFAPPAMGWWEEQVLMTTQARSMSENVSLYVRYIDDIFILWQGSEESAKCFADQINDNSLILKFTCTTSKEAIKFLDFELFVENNKIQSRTYRKPTSGNAILHASSFHPTNLKESITYAECPHMKCNCSTQSGLRQSTSDLFERLKCRGYSNKTLTRAELKSAKFTRKDLLFSKKREQ